MKEDVLYIIIPAYNEEANIRTVIEEWYPVVEAHSGGGLSRMIIVNDGSRDATEAIARREAQQRPLLQVLNKKNGGHGSAVLAGYRYAVGKKADYIFQTDSDGQTSAEEFEGFWQQRGRFDAVIGRRDERQDGLSRVIVTKTLRLILLLIFRRFIPDANAPYRLMKRNALRDALSYIKPDEKLPNVMISAVFAKERRRVLYHPITFKPRQGGSNSLNLPKIAKMGLEALRRFIKLERRLS